MLCCSAVAEMQCPWRTNSIKDQFFLTQTYSYLWTGTFAEVFPVVSEHCTCRQSYLPVFTISYQWELQSRNLLDREHIFTYRTYFGTVLQRAAENLSVYGKWELCWDSCPVLSPSWDWIHVKNYWQQDDAL